MSDDGEAKARGELTPKQERAAAQGYEALLRGDFDAVFRIAAEAEGGSMTFEQEIAYALAALVPGDAGVRSSVAERLAPRIVAAIDQAARTGCAIGRASLINGTPSETAHVVAIPQARAAVLDVLREG